jgi:prolyl 4-hydroxylase
MVCHHKNPNNHTTPRQKTTRSRGHYSTPSVDLLAYFTLASFIATTPCSPFTMMRFPTTLAGCGILILQAVLMALATAGHDTVTSHDAAGQFARQQQLDADRQEQEVPTTADVNVTTEDAQEKEMTCNDNQQHGQDEIVSEASYTGLTSPGVMVAAPQEDYGAEFGEIQVMDQATADAVMVKLESMRQYMMEKVRVEEKYKLVKDICRNQHESCTFWATLGECEKNPAYMSINCAPVCQTCELLHVETRCPLDPNAVDAFAKPGDVNAMFTRIISDPFYKQFGPKVLSRPDLAPGDTAETTDYNVGGPWMLLFENAITDEEANQLIELGAKAGYERSSDVGERKVDGTYGKSVNHGRTSTNAWCVGECYEDPLAQSVMNRIVNITGIPEPNSENLQLLRYEKDQYYQVHTDYINYQTERPSGVRILTFYFYLTDVEQGGGTSFPNVGLTVQPKKGQAVLWPSVLDEDPNQSDRRTDHTALPVIKGVKYGANAWIHQRDFKTPNNIGC